MTTTIKKTYCRRWEIILPKRRFHLRYYRITT